MEFVPAGTQLTPTQQRQRRVTLVLTLAFIAFVVATAFVLQLGSLLDVDAQTPLDIWRVKVWPRIEAKGQAGIFYAVTGVFVVAQAFMLYWIQRVYPFGRLMLDAEGIEHRPAPLPDALQLFDPPWRIGWRELRGVEHAVPRNLHAQAEMRAIVLVTADGRRRRLRPFRWEVAGWPDPEGPRMHGGFLALTRRGPQETARFIAHPLLTALAARGFALREPEPAALPLWQRPIALAGTSYDLAGNRATQVGVAVFFATAAYGILDLVADRYRFAGPAPEHWFVGLGMVAAGIAFAGFRVTRTPLVESLIVALLVGGGIGFAARPAALRVNAWTDVDGPQIVRYTLGPGSALIAPSAGSPAVATPQYDYRYWNAFRPGEHYPLSLQRGALGFWQLDTAPIRAEVDAFRRFDDKHAAEARAHARRIVDAQGETDEP